jgi:hypothetical protein
MKPKFQNTVAPFGYFFRNLPGLAVLALLATTAVIPLQAADGSAVVAATQNPTLYKTIKVNGLDIFYREAGPTDAPAIILLHGFPTSSHMFRNLIPALSDKYHVIAPDYPGYGQSSMPRVSDFKYTFDNLTDVVEGFIQKLEIRRYSLYVMDYGAPVGFRIASGIRTRAIVDHSERQRLRGWPAGFLETRQGLLE